MRNIQGDVTALVYVDSNGNAEAAVEYYYSAFGEVYVDVFSGSVDYSAIAELNPIRFRGYFYDTETNFYYLDSRYYDPEIGRFINGDRYISTGQGIIGTNMFAYCNNNPINLTDPFGGLPKWITGMLNVVSGGLQIVAGATLITTSGWTGVGAAAGTALFANGAATATQGIGQIYNSVTNTSTLREDNIIRTGVQDAGAAIGGNIGSAIAGTLYDIAIMTASAYAGSTMALKSTLSNKTTNPGIPFKSGVTGMQYGIDPNTLTPVKDLSSLNQYRMANAVKYGSDHAVEVGITGKIHDGHHRVADAISNGRAIDIYVHPYE